MDESGAPSPSNLAGLPRWPQFCTLQLFSLCFCMSCGYWVSTSRGVVFSRSVWGSLLQMCSCRCSLERGTSSSVGVWVVFCLEPLAGDLWHRRPTGHSPLLHLAQEMFIQPWLWVYTCSLRAGSSGSDISSGPLPPFMSINRRAGTLGLTGCWPPLPRYPALCVQQGPKAQNYVCRSVDLPSTPSCHTPGTTI